MSEISGIIRNGIERGWPSEEIRISLINSGYSQQEVDLELSQILNSTSMQNISATKIVKAPISIPNTPSEKFNPQNLTNYQTPSIEKKASNKVVIAIIILLVLCVLAGAGLFLFG